MPLTCSCDDNYDWFYLEPEDFTTLATKRARKCCSCGSRIAVGDDCVRFNRFRPPATVIEERIEGDEVPMADKWMCEECGGLYFSLTELGFCINLNGESMRSLVREYAEVYQPLAVSNGQADPHHKEG